MTASRALNGHPRVGLETRSRVLQVAEELGYRPSHAARSLRTSQSRLLGVFSPDLMMPLHHEIVLGARDGAAGEGYRLLLGTGGVEDDRPAPLSCDGDLVLHSTAMPMPTLAAHDPARTVCLMGRPPGWPPTAVDVCTTDLGGITALAVEHLALTGYRRVALLTHASEPVLGGYGAAVREHGLAEDAALVHSIGNDGASVGRAVGALASLPTPPDALLVVSVAATPLVLRAWRRRGVALGRDLGLVGTEGSRGIWGDLVDPAITAIRIPGFEIGAAGARRLIERLEGNQAPPREVEFPAELTVRESTPGPPRAARSGRR